MRKKVKKIPKYSLGMDMVSALNGGEISASSKKLQGIGGMANQAAIGGQMIGSALGIELGLNAQIANGVASILEGVPVIGGMLAAPIRLWGGLAGGGGSVDESTGEITKSSGITRLMGWGRDDDALAFRGNRIKNAILSRLQTENLKADYMNQYGGAVKVAEGGIMRRPVDALVSKGELIYDPTTKKLRQVPGSEGRPNKADDVYAKLYEGDVVISNSPTMLMANGKTPAQNLMGMVDKYATGGTVKAREAIIKKVVNWQEANKTKPQEYAKFDEGWSGEIKSWDDYLKYSYGLSKNNKIDKLENFWGYDSKNGKYNHRWSDIIKHIGSNKALREKAIKDLGGLSYIGTGDDAWDNIVKAAYDTKPADVHRYFKSVGDVLTTQKDPLKQPIVGLGRIINVPKGISQKNVRSSIGGVDHMTSYIPQQESEKLTKLTPEQIKQFNKNYATSSKNTSKSGSQNESNWLNDIGGLLPVIGGLFDKYDWHKETAQITPPRFVPVNADPRPLLRAADESSSIGNYNLANMGVGTGAYLAHSALLASDRAKRYADAYQWQQETNNKLIAQNAGIYNDWRKQRDAYVTQAIADTRANEGAAQQMRDQARKDRLEFYYGNRNDKMKLAALDPLLKYAFDDKTYKKIYNSVV